MKALLGSLCILGGGALGIRMQARERRRRQVLLRDLAAALWRMEEEIRLKRTPLPRLLSGLSASFPGEAGAFLGQVSAAVRNGESPERVWKREAESLPLSERDRSVLLSLNFRGDETALCGAAALLARQLERSREELESEEAQEGRRTAALWASGAALLVILLI